jgi:galactokinase
MNLWTVIVRDMNTDINGSIPAQSVLERFFNGHTDYKPHAVDLLVTGSVPPGSGLSSSAAMVVASTLSFLAANDKLQGLSKGDLVRMAVVNERRVGVNSGG